MDAPCVVEFTIVDVFGVGVRVAPVLPPSCDAVRPVRQHNPIQEGEWETNTLPPMTEFWKTTLERSCRSDVSVPPGLCSDAPRMVTPRTAEVDRARSLRWRSAPHKDGFKR